MLRIQRANRKEWKKEVIRIGENGWSYDDDKDVVCFMGVEFCSLLEFMNCPQSKIVRFVKKVKEGKCV